MLYPSIFKNDLFDDIFDDFLRTSKPSFSFNSSIMKTDIKENKDSYDLFIDIPGVSKEDVSVELKDGALEIKAVSKYDNKDEELSKYLRRERFYGSMSRSFYVGDKLTKDDIKAKFENGVLKLNVPKIEAKPEIEEKQYISIE